MSCGFKIRIQIRNDIVKLPILGAVPVVRHKITMLQQSRSFWLKLEASVLSWKNYEYPVLILEQMISPDNDSGNIEFFSFLTADTYMYQSRFLMTV